MLAGQIGTKSLKVTLLILIILMFKKFWKIEDITNMNKNYFSKRK